MMTEKNSTSEIRKLAESYDMPILQKLGFDNITSKGIQQKCPIHNGDNPAAFSFDRNRMCWSCFTHGCHKKYGNDIIGLIRSIRNISYKETIDWVVDVINDPEISAGYIPQEKNTEITKVNAVISEDHLKNLRRDFSSISNRFFSEKTLINFESGVPSEKTKIQHNRLMIPIRNSDGNLIGFTGRSIYDKCHRTDGYHPEWINQDGKYTSIFSKWRHYPKGLNKSIELYNFHNAKKFITRVGFAVVVEGPFDLWRMWEFGVKNCVAIFGCNISAAQVNKLRDIGCRCIALGLDSDEAGMAGIDKSKILFSGKIDIEKLCLPIDKDPCELDLNDYNNLIKPQLSVLKGRYENKTDNNNW